MTAYAILKTGRRVRLVILRARRGATPIRKTAAALIIGSFMISACGGDQAVESEPAGSGPGASGGPSEPTGRVVAAVTQFETEDLDPRAQSISARPYYGAMFDPLIGATADGELDYSLGVLESAEPDATATEWTLTLRPGITFHDGSEATADDVTFSIDYLREPTGSSVTGAYLSANLESVETIGDYTTTVTLKSPNVDFPIILGPIEGDLSLIPKAYFDEVGAEGFAEQPIGSGPWKFAGRGLGEFIEFDANTDYWNEDAIPQFAELRVELVPDAASRKAKLRTGEVDLAQLDPQDVDEMASEGFTISGPQMIAYPMVNFFGSYDPNYLTSKLEFRKALILAVDRAAIVEAFYTEGTATLATGSPLFSPITAGFDETLPAYPYDPEEAEALLAEIGYDNEEVTFYSFAFPGLPEMPQVNTAIADYWRAVGVNVRTVDMDWGTFLPMMVAHDWAPPAPVAQTGTQPRPSLVGNVRVYMVGPGDGGIVAGYPNTADILETYNELSQTPAGEERDSLLRDLGAQWYEDYWAMPIVWRNGPWAVGSRVAEWSPASGTSTYLNFHTLVPSESASN